MADIQSATAEIRGGKKKERKKPQGKNIMACPITQGGHKNEEVNAQGGKRAVPVPCRANGT